MYLSKPFAAGFALLAFSFTHPLSAAMIVGEPTNFGDDDVNVVVTIDDMIMAGGVTFSIEVIPTVDMPNTADLQGFFFNADESVVLGDIDISSNPEITAIAEDTTNLGGGNNVNGGPVTEDFDFGLTIGTPGIGGDDFQTAGFFVSGANLDDFAGEDFAVRATSTGEPGSSRNGSSKLFGTFPTLPPVPPDTTIPEPSSVMLLGLGLVAMGWFTKRRTAGK